MRLDARLEELDAKIYSTLYEKPVSERLLEENRDALKEIREEIEEIKNYVLNGGDDNDD